MGPEALLGGERHPDDVAHDQLAVRHMVVTRSDDHLTHGKLIKTGGAWMAVKDSVAPVLEITSAPGRPEKVSFLHMIRVSRVE